METRANFVLIGVFTLAVIAGAFLFVIWFAGLAKLNPQASYQVVFTGSVSGLSTGGSVLFNGLKVGEVGKIAFDKADPSKVVATINVDAAAPIKKDTKARLEVQGLTGAAALALTGGSRAAPPLVGEHGEPPTIVAGTSQLQTLLDSVQTLSNRAEDVFTKADTILANNGPAIDSTLANVAKFSQALGDNASGVNAALTSLGDLGAKLGPLSGHLDTLTGDLDKLVQAVDAEKVRSTVDNVQSFSQTLAQSKDSIQSVLADTTSLAKRLNGTSQRLDLAIDDIDTLAKAVDAGKLHNTLDNIQTFSGALAASSDTYRSLLSNLGGIADAIDKQKVGAAVDHIEAFTGTLADNKETFDSLFKNAGDLAAHLVNSSQKLDTALDDADKVVKAVDADKLHGALDNIESFSGALADSKDTYRSLLSDLGGIAKAIDKQKVGEAVDHIDVFTGTLADNKETLDSLFKNADDLSKRLVDSSQKLDTALTDVDTLVKAVDPNQVSGAVNSVQEFAATLSANRGNVDRTLKDAAELSAKLNGSADKIDGLIDSLQGFVGSPETKGTLTDIGDAAKSVRRLADDLDVRAKDIAVGLTRFSNSGLREFESLAIEARRAVNDIDRTVRSLEKNPTQLIFGAKPSLPEYRGGH